MREPRCPGRILREIEAASPRHLAGLDSMVSPSQKPTKGRNTQNAACHNCRGAAGHDAIWGSKTPPARGLGPWLSRMGPVRLSVGIGDTRRKGQGSEAMSSAEGEPRGAGELPVAVGVDGSDRSYEAALWAAREAGSRGASLDVVHATMWSVDRTADAGSSSVIPDVWVRQAQEMLTDVADSCRRDVTALTVRTRLEWGSPRTMLIEQSAAAQLVVVGDRGLGGFAPLLVGSVTLGLVAAARCPVVMVRSGSGARPERAGTVVAGVEDSSADELVLDFAFAVAARWECRLIVVHGWIRGLDANFLRYLARGDQYWLRQRATFEAALREQVSTWQERYPKVEVSVLMRHDDAARLLLHAARDARLLAVGARGRGESAPPALGSVSHAMVHYAPCPVAVLPT
ncbi:MAG: hypothetical protein GEU98_01575 [Pseudonocardiaceae bacterium]|nr:hypothetical protein [Pseudonocardiaceae bacterium]